MKNKLYITLILLLLCCRLFCQEKHDYNYVVRDKIVVDSVTGLYAHKDMEFKVTRIAVNDGIFKECGLFQKAFFLKDPIYFKICNNKWYVLEGKKKVSFYPVPAKREITLNKRKFVFENVEECLINNVKCTTFIIRPSTTWVSTIVKYYFNEKYGVIMVNVDGTDLIREDFFAN
jgi:hypothetical protein